MGCSWLFCLVACFDLIWVWWFIVCSLITCLVADLNYFVTDFVFLFVNGVRFCDGLCLCFMLFVWLNWLRLYWFDCFGCLVCLLVEVSI